MGCVCATPCCNALKYHKLSRVKRDHYKERRARRILLCWQHRSLWAGVVLIPSTALWQAAAQKKQKIHNMKLKFSSLRYYIERFFSVPLIMTWCTAPALWYFPGKARLIHFYTKILWSSSLKELVSSSLEGAHSRLTHNHSFPPEQRGELWPPQEGRKEHTFFQEESRL